MVRTVNVPASTSAAVSIVSQIPTRTAVQASPENDPEMSVWIPSISVSASSSSMNSSPSSGVETLMLQGVVSTIQVAVVTVSSPSRSVQMPSTTCGPSLSARLSNVATR